ncbi:hypothetical protein [Blastococcus capsensis]|uniref:hypothetical protein n=1 Tax=Blastococcus capsensis TaxID=1564163 RepID=UPI002540D713|nr:hypothetical protein [Blastococcus capsensis]MDK3258926.1 hypothetical protein [Blastococcus capsensis]
MRLTIDLGFEAEDDFDEAIDQSVAGADISWETAVKAKVAASGDYTRTAERLTLDHLAGEGTFVLGLPLDALTPASTVDERAEVTLRCTDVQRLSLARALWMAGAAPHSHLSLMVAAGITPPDVAAVMGLFAVEGVGRAGASVPG